MGSGEKAFVIVVAIIGIVLVSGFTGLTISSVKGNQIEKEKIAACASSGMEWRPITRPNTSYVDMGCVAPDRR